MAHWRYDTQPLLRYATMPEAPLYREIMEIFAEAFAGMTVFAPGATNPPGMPCTSSVGRAQVRYSTG